MKAQDLDLLDEDDDGSWEYWFARLVEQQNDERERVDDDPAWHVREFTPQ